MAEPQPEVQALPVEAPPSSSSTTTPKETPTHGAGIHILQLVTQNDADELDVANTLSGSLKTPVESSFDNPLRKAKRQKSDTDAPDAPVLDEGLGGSIKPAPTVVNSVPARSIARLNNALGIPSIPLFSASNRPPGSSRDNSMGPNEENRVELLRKNVPDPNFCLPPKRRKAYGKDEIIPECPNRAHKKKTRPIQGYFDDSFLMKDAQGRFAPFDRSALPRIQIHATHCHVRCARALKVRTLEEFLLEVENNPAPHYTVEIASAVCPQCPVNNTKNPCLHTRSHFQSTKNSKRMVHVVLFWKRLLGPSFPVVDELLTGEVWKNLASCEQGVKTSNGHVKNAKLPFCVNPSHYLIVNCLPLIQVLLETMYRVGYFEHPEVVEFTNRLITLTTNLRAQNLPFTNPVAQRWFDQLVALVRKVIAEVMGSLSHKGPNPASQQKPFNHPCHASSSSSSSNMPAADNEEDEEEDAEPSSEGGDEDAAVTLTLLPSTS